MKEMPIEEKYNQILNFMIFEKAMSYTYHKKQGTLNKWLDYTLVAYRGYMGPMLKMMKNARAYRLAISRIIILWRKKGSITLNTD
jgi:hypothetical protein